MFNSHIENASDGGLEQSEAKTQRRSTKLLVLSTISIIGALFGATSANAQSATASQNYGANDVERRIVSVNQGENMFNALVRSGVNALDAKNSMRALSQVFDTGDIKKDDRLTVFLRQSNAGKRLIGYTLASGSDQSITVNLSANGEYRARQLNTTMQKKTLRVAGVIGVNGLMSTVLQQGAPERVAERLADAFAYDVDFERDIGPGSSFEIIFDRVSDSRGTVFREGEPTFARITLNNGRTLQLYSFKSPNDTSARWYDAYGRSAQKFLMKTPVNGAHITSGFGMRVHPVSGFTKMHEGIDFGTPVGTPVLAAGDGVISRAGIAGGYGNVVDISHSSGWSTRYGHLSRFAPGITAGTRVKQGQVIAYSGNTGRSTGPHLHYEIRLNGVALDPTGTKVPSGMALSGDSLAKFNQQVSRINNLRRTASFNNTDVASNSSNFKNSY